MKDESIAVDGVQLDTCDVGSGEPAVCIQTALTADELEPVAADPALDDHRRILCHRRGYAGSSLVEGPGSIRRDTSDCAGLLAPASSPAVLDRGLRRRVHR